MSTIDVSELLRPGLLEGVSIVLAGAPAAAEAGESPGAAVRAACAELGARVSDCQLACDGSLELDEAAMEEAVDRALADVGSVELLAVDGASLFAHGGGRAVGPRARGRRSARAWTRAGTSRAPSPAAPSCPAGAAGESSTWRPLPMPASTPTPRAPAWRTWRARSRSSGLATGSRP